MALRAFLFRSPRRCHGRPPIGKRPAPFSVDRNPPFLFFLSTIGHEFSLLHHLSASLPGPRPSEPSQLCCLGLPASAARANSLRVTVLPTALLTVTTPCNHVPRLEKRDLPTFPRTVRRAIQPRPNTNTSGSYSSFGGWLSPHIIPRPLAPLAKLGGSGRLRIWSWLPPTTNRQRTAHLSPTAPTARPRRFTWHKALANPEDLPPKAPETTYLVPTANSADYAPPDHNNLPRPTQQSLTPLWRPLGLTAGTGPAGAATHVTNTYGLEGQAKPVL
jgi:hypothetical protein